ncbi:hypothetical protein [Fimbriiglobus ruber]|uniref:DUF4440 domain-containing protein n=1 Tax=Fimbriiglobus ruber TaxID=1908690 RepID=A0A225E463_9BACT|nr:hypothetical protein [Fimbriiglobus ruber]OWK43197.1 hypothetical protein FRUB_02796 [Fimbriiglobus ruber]
MKTLHRIWLLALFAAAAGCEKSPPPPPEKIATGAEKVAHVFFEALMHEDWTAAYDTLDPDSRAWCGKDQFTTKAKAYLGQIGFTPTEVGVAASETADSASAVAVFRGVSGTSPKQHKDGTALHRTPTGWAVVLRKNFGVESATPPPAPSKGGKG